MMDYAEQLRKQLRFIENSCRLYDEGQFDEAVRIATNLRVIFHNTPKSISLLRHLNQTTVSLLSTCVRIPDNIKTDYWPGLIQVIVNPSDATLISKPKFDATPHAHRKLLFSTWWEEVIYWGSGKRIKRNRLILDAANTDGGAHVDKSLPEKYNWMVCGTQFSIQVDRPDRMQAHSNLSFPHLASIRQIAYEVLNSDDLLRLAASTP